MKKFAMLLLLPMAIGCSHTKPQSRHTTFSEGEATYPLTVTDCHGKLVAIYADREMTINMANPIWPDRHGNASFWAPSTVCISWRNEEKAK